MKRRLIIKSYKVRANSNDNISRIIVVGLRTSKVNGYYIEKVGVCIKHQSSFMYVVNLSRIGYWLNKGAILKPRISWIIGILGKGLLKYDEK